MFREADRHTDNYIYLFLDLPQISISATLQKTALHVFTQERNRAPYTIKQPKESSIKYRNIKVETAIIGKIY